MATSIRIDNPDGLVELLVTTAQAPLRDRILLEAVHGSGLAAAVALWRPLGGRGGTTTWTRLLARGALDELPRRSELEAVEARELPPELRPGCCVLLAGRGPSRVALTLGGHQSSAAELDRLEAIVAVLAALDPPQATGWIQRLPSLLPRRSSVDQALGQALREQLAPPPPFAAGPGDPGPTEDAGQHPRIDLLEVPPLPRAPGPRGGAPSAPEEATQPAGDLVVAAVRRGLERVRGILTQRGICTRLVVRGRLDGSTRLPAEVLEELVAALLLGVSPSRAEPSSAVRRLRIGLRDEPSAWHLRIAPVPDEGGLLPDLRFARLCLPIGTARPAEHVLVRFLAAGGVLRSQGSGSAPRGWFLRLPKPRQ